MSKKIFSNITISISVVFVVAVIGFAFFSGVANATITGATITASTTRDSVVGTSSAVYNVAFDTTSTQTATTITITFPTGFTVQNGTLSTSTIISASSTAGYISVGGVNTTSTALTGSSANRTVVVTIAATNLSTLNGVWFRLTSTTITNATTSGTSYATTTSNASDEVASSSVPITLIADTATKLGFTTQPASATSGIAFVTQPVVAVQDQYGNTSTTYSGTVTLTATTTDGSSPGTLGGTLTKALSSGVADFASNGVKFTAVTDGQTFAVVASLSPLTPATSTPDLTANVVATKLVFTTQPAGAVSGVALGTQPVVTAQNAAGTTDTDFTSTVSLSPTSTTALGSVSNASMAAVLGVAAFTGAVYNPSADNETFQLSASGGGLTIGDSTSLVARFYHGVGGGGGYVAPVVVTPTATTTVATTTPAVTTTTPAAAVETTPSVTMENLSGQELLNALVERLKALLQAASAAGIQLPDSAKAYMTPAARKLSEITKNLSFGSVGQEVKMLQEFLNSTEFVVAQSGPGSAGNETTRFGGLTRAALAKYQANVGISPASGLFGPITRAYLKSIGF